MFKPDDKVTFEVTVAELNELLTAWNSPAVLMVIDSLSLLVRQAKTVGPIIAKIVEQATSQEEPELPMADLKPRMDGPQPAEPPNG